MEKFEETELVVEYQDQCLATESQLLEKITLHYSDGSVQELDPRLLHAILGMATEAGEMLDQLKKSLFYMRKLDRTNLLEEIGDHDWYESLGLAALKSNRREVFKMNVKKLQEIRYKKKKFTQEEALNRNLEAERKSLDESAQRAEANDGK